MWPEMMASILTLTLRSQMVVEVENALNPTVEVANTAGHALHSRAVSGPVVEELVAVIRAAI